MKKFLGALAFATLLAGGPSFAADMPFKALYKAPPPVFTWTGLYLGLNAGYGWNKTTGDGFCATPAAAGGIAGGPGCWPSVAGTVKPHGGLGGAQLGYNYQTGLFVWGIESDIQVGGIRNTSLTAVPCCIPALTSAIGGYVHSQDLEWFGTVRGRLGIAAWDRALIYGTGGLIYGQENVSAAMVFPLVTYTNSATAMRSGWVAGAGLEYAFTNNFSAKIEGLFYDMGSQSIGFTSPVTTFSDNATFNFKGSMVRLGANLKFGP
jgi:outer membrane immunogenic protein